jgi:peptide/nickel transport system substrate-binding protein
MRRVLGLLGVAYLLAGCTRADTAATGARHPWTQPHVLRLGDVADPDSLNPLLSTMDLSYDLSSLVFSYLVIAGRDGVPVGDLATAVPSLRNGGVSPDGKTYTYRLHKGVLWHDGVTLTAGDVAFTWRAIMSSRNNVLHREGYDEVRSIDTPDASTVVVHLRRRYPPFVSEFFTTLQEGAKPVLPAHLLANLGSINDAPFNAAPVGSGPFRFARWDRATRIVLERNEHYFKGRPKLERVELTILPDENTVLTAMRMHAIDMPAGTSQLTWNLLRNAEGISTRLDPWNSQMLLALDDARPALRELAVRRAISAAIDYRAIIDKLTYGSAQPASDVVAPNSLGYAGNTPYRYDPARARALLESAGWHAGADGLRRKGGAALQLVMVVASKGSGPLYAVQLQSMLHDVGIDLTIKAYPYKGIYAYDGPIVTGNYDLALFANTLPFDPDRTSTLTCDEFSPKGENEFRFCDRKVDELERAGLETDDPIERAAIYRRASRLIHDEVPYIPLFAQRRPAAMNDDLRGYDPSPAAAPWWNAWSWDI